MEYDTATSLESNIQDISVQIGNHMIRIIRNTRAFDNIITLQLLQTLQYDVFMVPSCKKKILINGSMLSVIAEVSLYVQVHSKLY